MKNLDMTKCLVVLSGGQDSTTCLFLAVDELGPENVRAISFDYKQRHATELECATRAASKLKVQHEIFDLSLLSQLTPNALVRNDIPITIEPGELPSTFVDGRNLLFLTIAAIRAKQQGIGTIMTGVCQTDFSGYPDCRAVFVKSCNATISLALGVDIDIVTPLMFMTKAETWELADVLNAFEYIRHNTVTCYEGIIGEGCGECPACELRMKGLEEYLDSWEEGPKV